MPEETQVDQSVSEETSLLGQSDSTRPPVSDDCNDEDLKNRNGLPIQNSRRACILFVICVVVCVMAVLFLKPDISHSATLLMKAEPLSSSKVTATNNTADKETRDQLLTSFPPDFVWGAATSSYQIEGATQEGGRGETVWDVFVRQPGAVMDNSTGDVACDHYHQWKSDIALMKSLNIRAYRFSIAWSRILPTGVLDPTKEDGGVNVDGIGFYDQLIDELIDQGIEPWITLFHWDLPQWIQENYDGGWLDNRTIEAFENYARIIFRYFGDRVKHFITLNEPWTYSVNGHGSGIHAPGRNQNPAIEPYIVAHNFILAHARVYRIYQSEFATQQQGMIGISNSGDFRYPKRPNSHVDQQAAERAMLFQFGWFVDPILKGDYPDTMRERLGERLPTFSETQRKEVLGSTDFLGLNYYSVFLASEPKHEATYGGYWADIFVDFSNEAKWEQNDMGWNVDSHGLQRMLKWISARYDNPLVYVTENGSAEKEPDLDTAMHDEKRKLYIENHLLASAKAISGDNVNLAGYFAWSLMDNFEWQFGYQRRFGMTFVDFDTLERTPKQSAVWYRDIIEANNDSGAVAVREQLGRRKLRRRLLSIAKMRQKDLPQRVLIGYVSDIGAVRQSVYNGVNVVIWSFIDIVAVRDNTGDEKETSKDRILLEDDLKNSITEESLKARVSTHLNLTAVKILISELAEEGYADVIHIAAFGGWNGPHIDPQLSANEWYRVFRNDLGDIFDGIDWDFEGNDDITNRFNFFTMKCLDSTGAISKMAKEDGYFVTMAPPQSYLDIDTAKFSRYVNLTDHKRQWHDEFSYYGANVYAYLLAKYGQWIDLVSMQFYESFSRAAQAVYSDGAAPAEYLQHYVQKLVENKGRFLVDFSTDPEVDLPAMEVILPLEKLVLGFANGWAVNSPENKHIFFPTDSVKYAWSNLTKTEKSTPRGFMFWTINEEGTNGVYLARDLAMILFPDGDARKSDSMKKNQELSSFLGPMPKKLSSWSKRSSFGGEM